MKKSNLNIWLIVVFVMTMTILSVFLNIEKKQMFEEIEGAEYRQYAVTSKVFRDYINELKISFDTFLKDYQGEKYIPIDNLKIVFDRKNDYVSFSQNGIYYKSRLQVVNKDLYTKYSSKNLVLRGVVSPKFEIDIDTKMINLNWMFTDQIRIDENEYKKFLNKYPLLSEQDQFDNEDIEIVRARLTEAFSLVGVTTNKNIQILRYNDQSTMVIIDSNMGFGKFYISDQQINKLKFKNSTIIFNSDGWMGITP